MAHSHGCQHDVAHPAVGSKADLAWYQSGWSQACECAVVCTELTRLLQDLSSCRSRHTIQNGLPPLGLQADQIGNSLHRRKLLAAGLTQRVFWQRHLLGTVVQR